MEDKRSRAEGESREGGGQGRRGSRIKSQGQKEGQEKEVKGRRGQGRRGSRIKRSRQRRLLHSPGEEGWGDVGGIQTPPKAESAGRPDGWVLVEGGRSGARTPGGGSERTHEGPTMTILSETQSFSRSFSWKLHLSVLLDVGKRPSTIC